MILEHVVPRAMAQRLRPIRLARRIDQGDHGRVVPSGLQQPDRLMQREVRHIQLGQDHIQVKVQGAAETLLVRRDGEDALFLNELKYVQNTALDMCVPLENTEVLAVKAVLGQVGIAQGLDYRGVRVIGHLSAVPESPWYLVARMDTAEAYAPLRERLWQAGWD